MFGFGSNFGGVASASAASVIGNAQNAVTDALSDISDALGVSAQSFAGQLGRFAGQVDSLGAAAVTKDGLAAFALKGGAGLFSQYTAPLQAILGDNLQLSHSLASNAISAIKTGGFAANAQLFFDPTTMSVRGGARIGPLGISLDKNGISIAGVKGYVDAKVQAALPSYADHIIRGAGLGPLVGTALTSKSQAQDIIDGVISAGKTVTTAVSSTNLGIAVGSNMATVTVGGIPLGGSTSALAKKLKAAVEHGSMGGASGMPTIKITAALPGGSTIGVAQNVYALNLFNPAAYNTGALNIETGRYAGGAGAELAASSVTNDYVTHGVIDSVGQIEAAEVGSLSATAGTVKGGVLDPFGQPLEAGMVGGVFGGGGNTSDGGTGTADPGSGFGNDAGGN